MTSLIRELPRSAEATPSTGLLSLDYARATFAHTQELVRLMDTKAFYIMNAAGMLTTGLGIFTSLSLTIAPGVSWRSATGATAGAAALVYLVLAALVVGYAIAVFRASSGARLHQVGPRLLFPPSIRGGHGTDAHAYYERLACVETEDVLADYADSIVALSAIYEAKQSRVNRGVAALRALAGVWLVMIAVLLCRSMFA